MLIGRSHTRWAVAAGVITVLGAANWVHVTRNSFDRSFARTPAGLVHGAVALALIAFAAALPLRRLKPAWRIGSAEWWMHAHVWAGLLSVPATLYHASFQARGSLGAALAVSLAVVVGSGIFGLLVQQFLPRWMTRSCPDERVHDHIAELRVEQQQRTRAAVASAATAVDGPDDGPNSTVVSLAAFYVERVAPYLTGREAWVEVDAGDLSAFERLLLTLPPGLQPIAQLLRDSCAQERQFRAQLRLHRWLHAWVLVHGPLSMVLVILVATHVVSVWWYR